MNLEEKIEDLKQDFSLLIEAGFVAVKQLDPICSSRLFIAAQMISPSHTAPQIGLGYIALNQLNVKEATHIFEEVTKKEPENLLARTFLGICYLLSKPKSKKDGARSKPGSSQRRRAKAKNTRQHNKAKPKSGRRTRPKKSGKGKT